MSIQQMGKEEGIRLVGNILGAAAKVGIQAYQNQSDDVPFADRVELAVKVVAEEVLRRIDAVED